MRRIAKLGTVAVLVLAAVLLLVRPTHGTTSTLTGTIVDGQGNPVNGTITLQLPVPAMDVTTNRAVANTPVTYRIVNGVIQGGTTVPLFDVANLQPQNLYYSARVTDNAGTLVFTGNYAVTGATYNFGAAIPTNVTTSNISYVAPAVTNASNVFCCTQTFQGQIVSTLATGTAPFSITSTTLVPNLNTQVLNGVTVTGVPSFNQVLTATSASAANWQSPASTLFATYTNDTVTGTVAGLLVKLTGAPSKAITVGLTDTGGVVGICVSGCGTSGSASVSTVGQASCTFDGATVAGDYAKISSTVQGNCHDAGATYPTPAGQVIGRVLSTNGGGGLYNMALFGIEIQAQPIIKTARNSTVCSTTNAAGNTCTTTVTWPTAFADANYEVSCSGITPTQYPFYMGITSQLAASVTIQISNGSAGQAQISTFGALSCIGVHN